MPSLIGVPGADGQVSSGAAANYRQQIVPFSRFGTRKVAWFKIGYADTSDNGMLDMTKFNTLIDAIQTQAEVVMIGAPVIRDNYGKFMVAVFEDTTNNGEDTDPEGEYQDNSNSKTLQQALRDITSDDNLEVSRWYLYGAPGTNFSSAEGWDQSNAYQEYDTKAQFLDSSYTQNNC